MSALFGFACATFVVIVLTAPRDAVTGATMMIALIAGAFGGWMIDAVLARNPKAKTRGLVCDDELAVTGTDSVIVAAVLPKMRSLPSGYEIVIRNQAGIIMFPEVRETK